MEAEAKAYKKSQKALKAAEAQQLKVDAEWEYESHIEASNELVDVMGALRDAKSDLDEVEEDFAKLRETQADQAARMEALRQLHLEIDRERRRIAKLAHPDEPVPPPVPVHGPGGEEYTPLPIEPYGPVAPTPVTPRPVTPTPVTPTPVGPVVDLRSTSAPLVEGLNFKVDSAAKKLLLLGFVYNIIRSLGES